VAGFAWVFYDDDVFWLVDWLICTFCDELQYSYFNVRSSMLSIVVSP
jgi:hypothetical protein